MEAISTSTPMYLLNPQLTSVMCKFASATLIWLFVMIKNCMFNVRPILKLPLIFEVLKKKKSCNGLININQTYIFTHYQKRRCTFASTLACHWGRALSGTAVTLGWVLLCTFVFCTLRAQSCTSGGNFVS